jgi:hypothetical protein
LRMLSRPLALLVCHRSSKSEAELSQVVIPDATDEGSDVERSNSTSAADLETR